MTLRGLAAAILLTASGLALAGCNMFQQQQQPTVQTGRTESDRQAVGHVQSELQRLGYYNGTVDGVWGSQSSAAMAKFQQSKGLPMTGELNPRSLQALAAATNGPAPGTTIPSIAQVQQELQDVGYYHARVDGIWGPQTRQAMATFQRNRGLPVTGQGDMQSMNMLAEAAQGTRTGSSGALPPPAGAR